METIKMTTKELIKGVADLTGKTQKDVKEVLDGIESVVTAQVGQASEDNSVDIRVFNGLHITSEFVAPHVARNPRTGETFTAEGKNRVKAKIGLALKNAANQ
jgi:nucleoid DNA-binding protein|nr:MAG TPA: Bacterial DNA-binding protein [Caudoviricetes sp.]